MSSNNDCNDPQNRPAARRGSIISSLLSLGSSPVTTAPKKDTRSPSISSSSPSDEASGFSPSSSTGPPRSGIYGSPNSSIGSPINQKSAPNNWPVNQNDLSPVSRHRQSSLGGSFGGFASGFRWPTPSAGTPQPIPIPSVQQPTHTDRHLDTNPSPVGSAPENTGRRTQTFRRPFELPNYTDVYAEPGPAREPTRGRSGSLFSSFGGSAAREAPRDRPNPPRRKLSPMGERMIRDHPF